MLALALLALVAADDPGFGGAQTDDAAEAPAEALPDDGGCVIKGDDGVWRSCDEALALKAAAKEAKAPADAGPLRDMSPEAQALRARMKAAEEAAQAPPPPPKTKLEIALDKAHLDPATMPLLALRVELARAQEGLDALVDKGAGGDAREAAEKKLASITAIDDDVERIALHRMDVCAQRRGNKPLVKNYRMTAGGPVLLTVAEMMARLPLVDPAGCERIILIDDKVVERVKRVHALREELATRDFGWTEIDERKALERELAALEAELAKDATPALSAPGVKDPYGRR